MAKVMVTGGAGFIGSNIAERLVKDGREVIVLDNLSTGKEKNVPEGAAFVKADLLDEKLLNEKLKDVETVYHLGASASVILGVENPVFDLDNNVKGTVNLLNAMKENNVEKILFASSSTVYGKNEIPMKESLKPNPVSQYAVGKIAVEYYLNSYYQIYGIKPYIFRIFNAFGKNQDLDNSKQGITGYIIGCVMQNKTFNVHGKGDQTRDYVHVDDVAEAFVRAEKEERAVNQIINLATGTQTSLLDWIKLIEDATGKKANLQFGRDYRIGDVMHYRANIDRLKEILGIEPKKDFKQLLKKTVEWAEARLK